MNKKISKTQAREEIEEFFYNIKSKSPKEIKKIKKTSASYKIKLKDKKKMFCKKCLTPYKNPKIRFKNKIKTTECKKCGYVGRWKIK